jgi:hypothetical protein
MPELTCGFCYIIKGTSLPETNEMPRDILSNNINSSGLQPLTDRHLSAFYYMRAFGFIAANAVTTPETPPPQAPLYTRFQPL